MDPRCPRGVGKTWGRGNGDGPTKKSDEILSERGELGAMGSATFIHCGIYYWRETMHKRDILTRVWEGLGREMEEGGVASQKRGWAEWAGKRETWLVCRWPEDADWLSRVGPVLERGGEGSATAEGTSFKVCSGWEVEEMGPRTEELFLVAGKGGEIIGQVTEAKKGSLGFNTKPRPKIQKLMYMIGWRKGGRKEERSCKWRSHRELD